MAITGHSSLAALRIDDEAQPTYNKAREAFEARSNAQKAERARAMLEALRYRARG